MFYFFSGTAVVFKVFCFFVSSQLLPCLKLAKKFNISLAVREDSKEKPSHSWLCKMENGVLFPLSSVWAQLHPSRNLKSDSKDNTDPPECKAKHFRLRFHLSHWPHICLCFPPAQLNIFPLLHAVSAFECLNVLALHQILYNHATGFMFYTNTLNFDIESCVYTKWLIEKLWKWI